HRLVGERSGRPGLARVVVRRVLGVGTGAVHPVERVDGHHIAVGDRVERGREEARDVGLVLREVVEVLVPDGGDGGGGVRAVAGEVQAQGGQAGNGRTAVVVRWGGEGLGLLRVDGPVEGVDQVLHLVVGDRGRAGHIPVPAVTGRERGAAGGGV